MAFLEVLCQMSIARSLQDTIEVKSASQGALASDTLTLEIDQAILTNPVLKVVDAVSIVEISPLTPEGTEDEQVYRTSLKLLSC